MFDAAQFVTQIQGWGRELGFSQIGVASVDLSSAEDGLRRWLEAGFHGEMGYMAAHGLKRARPAELVREVGQLARVVRKEGILGLENHHTNNEFLQKAINLCVDGHPPEMVEDALLQESQQTAERYDVAERVFRGIGESAPAIGMLGTLVGLV
ncbi:MAG: hypothetical protein B7X56_00215, partial [Burkholderiales bacterium 34-67-9]